MPQRTHPRVYKNKSDAMEVAVNMSIENPSWSIRVERYDESKTDFTNQSYNHVVRKKRLKIRNRISID